VRGCSAVTRSLIMEQDGIWPQRFLTKGREEEEEEASKYKFLQRDAL